MLLQTIGSLVESARLDPGHKIDQIDLGSVSCEKSTGETFSICRHLALDSCAVSGVAFQSVDRAIGRPERASDFDNRAGHRVRHVESGTLLYARFCFD